MKFKEIKTQDDIKELAQLASNIWHEYWPAIIGVEQVDYMLKKFQSVDAINRQIDDENYTYNIFYDDNNKSEIGYFGVKLQKDYLFLSKLYLVQDFRGIGCGKLALKKIKQYAQKYNKKVIQLTVNKNNVDTIKAYEAWGFKKVDAVVTDIGSGFVMDDYIMEYELQKN